MTTDLKTALAASIAAQRLAKFEESHPKLAQWWKDAQRGSIQYTYRTIVADGGTLSPAQMALARSVTDSDFWVQAGARGKE